MILKAEQFRHWVEGFNASDQEDVVNLVPNSGAWGWMGENVPWFECPDRAMEEIYYYRWWTYRKHLKATPAGTVLTEFILPVRHAGAYNTVSCALGHHIAEGRWLRGQGWLDEYVRFWFRGGEGGGPQAHFHKYSQWVAWAILERAKVTGDIGFAVGMLGDLVADYERWAGEKRLADGLFWQHDVWDGMEESISGGRRTRNRRPTINSYMYGNAVAIARVAEVAGKADVAEAYRGKAAELKRLVEGKLWDAGATFFKVLFEEDTFSTAREEIGFIPWAFELPGQGKEEAWKELIDPQGFWAPYGITTAERRHPAFRSHGVRNCEWDGAVWPFATSQTLDALAVVLRKYEQKFVTREHYLEGMQAYVKSQHKDGRPYIGEYLDEVTGEWLKGDNPRSRYYNHSTFCDLVIGGLCGVVPREDDVVEVDPLIPGRAWEWFCLDGVPYHGKTLSVVWDREGTRYGRGKGFGVYVDGREVARVAELGRVTGKLSGA